MANRSTEIRILEGSELTDNLADIAARTAEVATDGFGAAKNMSADRMAVRLRQRPSATLAEADGALLGFQLQSVHDNGLERYMYYVRAIRRSEQGRGLAARMLHAAIDHYQPTLVGARSQNPAEIQSFRRTMQQRGVEQVFPLATGPEATELRADLPAFLGALGFVDTTDPATGLSRGIFTEGRLGDYQVRANTPAIAEIENHFLSVGLDRDAGDALFYFARVAHPLAA